MQEKSLHGKLKNTYCKRLSKHFTSHKSK